MNSRERVLTAFSHKEPDRIPMWCGASEEFWIKAKRILKLDDEALRIRFHDDFRRVSVPYAVQTSCCGMDLKTLKAQIRHLLIYGKRQ